MNGAEGTAEKSLPVQESLLELFGPRREEVIERLKSALKYGEITRFGQEGFEVIFVPPPRPLLIPPPEPSKMLLPGKFPTPPGGEFYIVDGGGEVNAEMEGLWIRRGKYLKAVFRASDTRYISYLFLSPEEILVPFLITSSSPPMDTSRFPSVHEAIYYKKGGLAYLIKTTFSTPLEGAPLFTVLLKEMGYALQRVLSGTDRESELQRLLRGPFLYGLRGAVGLLREQYRRSRQRDAGHGEGLAGKISSLKGAGTITPQDVGSWVGALNGLVQEVTASLGALPLPGELKGMLHHFRKTFRDSEAIRSSVKVFRALQGTPRILLLTNLRLENLSEVENGVRYVNDPLEPILSEESLFSSPPSAHLSPLLNSLSRLYLVSFRMAALQQLKGNPERALALSRARFLLSTTPRRIDAAVEPASPLYQLKLVSEHGYLAEGVLKFAEKHLLDNLMGMYSEGGYNPPAKMVLCSLYLFAIMRQLYELKERIETGQLSTNYLADALLVSIRNLNKYESLYSLRGQKHAGGDKARS